MAGFGSSDRRSEKGAEGRARLMRAMLREIEADARETAYYTGRDALDARVMQAMADTRREEFVPAAERGSAYANIPLPIGHGQTISQPFIVALMTDLLQPRPDHVVLEVGTGCGYQAAVLSRLVRQVYSIEVVPELARDAAERLAAMGRANVEVRAGDGSKGWPEHAPFDGIIVTAAADQMPQALVDQIKPGGRMVIPVVGGAFQELRVVEKSQDGSITSRLALPVAFVPLVVR